MNKLVVHTDGGCWPNPGPGAWAFIVRDGEVVENSAGFLPHCTNNQAEYRALEAACITLARRDQRFSGIDIFSDSELMVKQVNGIYRVNDTIRPFYETAKLAFLGLQRICQVRLTHVRREHNSEADALCNDVLRRHGVVCVSKKNTGKKILTSA